MKLADQLRKTVQQAADDARKEERAKAARDKKDRAWRLKKFVQEELPKLPTILAEASKKGETKHVIYKEEMEQEYTGLLSKFAEENGLAFSSAGRWFGASRPDPDSGEGGHEAGVMYIFTLSW